MFVFLNALLEIAMLRRGPETLPSNVQFLRVVIVFSLVASALVLLVINEFYLRNILFFALSVCLFASFIYALLKLLDKTARFKQTLAACLGSDAIINLCMLPVAYVSVVSSTESMTFQLAGYAILFSFVWSIIVLTRILKHATELQSADCFIFAFGMNFLLLMMSRLI